MEGKTRSQLRGAGGAAGPGVMVTLGEVGWRQDAQVWDLDARSPGPSAGPSAGPGSALGPGDAPAARAAAGEERRLNADAASQHLAGILSVPQTQATYLK